MESKRAETKVERGLLEAVRRIATEEGRGESEVIEDALRDYVGRREGGDSFGEIFARVEEWQRRRGVEPLSEEEAMRLAVEGQRASRWHEDFARLSGAAFARDWESEEDSVYDEL